jgi:hypothetical protein
MAPRAVLEEASVFNNLYWLTDLSGLFVAKQLLGPLANPTGAAVRGA